VKKVPIGRRWQKGQSGNPGGKRKDIGHIREAARQYTIEAIETLVTWMRSDNSRASVAAAMALLERGWGRPDMRIEHGGSIDLTGIRERLERRIMSLDAPKDDPPVTH
jgi:uncharacterized protein DUF5681